MEKLRETSPSRLLSLRGENLGTQQRAWRGVSSFCSLVTRQRSMLPARTRVCHAPLHQEQEDRRVTSGEKLNSPVFV